MFRKWRNGPYCPSPLTCAAGTYSANGKQFFGDGACQNCTVAAGRYCAEGSSSATGSLCSVGHYCVGGSNDKQACSAPAGSYCAEGSSSATGSLCPAGYYCLGGSNDKQACTASGSYCAAGSSAPQELAHKLEITLTFARALTTDEQLKVRMGIASAVNTPVGNVELKLKTRRAVGYIATVYAADATAASAIETKLSDTASVTAAISAAGAPSPTKVVQQTALMISGGNDTNDKPSSEDSGFPLPAVIGIVVVVVLLIVAVVFWRLRPLRPAENLGQLHAPTVDVPVTNRPEGVSTANVEVELGHAHERAGHNVSQVGTRGCAEAASG